jgi:hypothetical protein
MTQDSRAIFRQVLSDSVNRLNNLSKSLGSCVEKARAYYEGDCHIVFDHISPLMSLT